MKPYDIGQLPTNYHIDRELLRLLAEASEKYGQYKMLINSLDSEIEAFLKSILIREVSCSYEIESIHASQDDIEKFKNAIEIMDKERLSLKKVNELHKILFRDEKKSDEIRTTQNWIGPRGCGIEAAIFVPPTPDKIEELLTNLYEHMMDVIVDPSLINVAISHAQFETIHPYNDGNGRLGRLLIPIQTAILDNERPILFLSETFLNYKKSYYHHLTLSRSNNMTAYIKFFLQCVIEQCMINISRIKQIKK